MKKRLLSLLLCCLMLSGVVTGCGSASEDDWKKYCIKDDSLVDFDTDYTAMYDIVDINEDGIPEIIQKGGISGGLYHMYSLYNNIDYTEIDISQPEKTEIAKTNQLYIYNNKIVKISMYNVDLESIFVWDNYPSQSDSDRLRVNRDEDPLNGNPLDTFQSVYSDNTSNLSESQAIELINDFLGTDVMSLSEPECPYTYDELVEALKNY